VSACGFSLFRCFVKKLRTSFHEAALITDFVIFSLCFFELACAHNHLTAQPVKH
jgi:hypothetical protein